MNPSYWLLIVLVSMAAVCFFVALIAYQVGYDRGHLDAEPDRHTHRKGDPLEPLPQAGRLPVDPAQPGPAPLWVFAGGWDEGAVSGSGEYELLTRTAEQSVDEDGDTYCLVCGHYPAFNRCGDECCASAPADETPSGFTRRMAREVDALIAAWEAQGNYDRHTIQAGE